MTKTVCDICGKEMPTAMTIGTADFYISSHGRVWDICTGCRVSLNKWMRIRKGESEEEADGRYSNND